MRFASWNINQRRDPLLQLDFLESLRCDAVALQEVSVGCFEHISSSRRYRHAWHSLDIRPVELGEREARAHGCALLVKELELVDGPRVVETFPAPEKTLTARVSLGETLVSLGSFYVPPGSGRNWGHDWKRRTLIELATWLALSPGPTVIGLDANSPWRDHPDVASNEYYRDGKTDDRHEYALHDPHRALHRKRDALRVYLEEHPERLDEIRKERPDGPLAISYVRRARGPCRYDHIFVSTDVRVVRVEYMYESIRSMSDHALVFAELELADTEA